MTNVLLSFFTAVSCRSCVSFLASLDCYTFICKRDSTVQIETLLQRAGQPLEHSPPALRGASCHQEQGLSWAASGCQPYLVRGEPSLRDRVGEREKKGGAIEREKRKEKLVAVMFIFRPPVLPCCQCPLLGTLSLSLPLFRSEGSC